MAVLLKLVVFVSLLSAVIGVECPDYWTVFNDHCYRFYRHQHSWRFANRFCQSVNAELVSINTEDENKFVSYLTSGSNESPVRGPNSWIGMGPNFHDQPDPKKWLDGNELTYALWEAGEPNNNGGREDCLETNWNRRGEWNDRPCNSNVPFICEMSPSPKQSKGNPK